MDSKDVTYNIIEDLQKQLAEKDRQMQELLYQLQEAEETIEAIRSGQIDALVVQNEEGHQLYTLRTADQTYRVFIEKMTEGAVTLNAQGMVMYANTQFATMVNQPLSNVIGLSFNQFIAPDSMPDYNRLFENSWQKDCKGEAFLLSGENRVPVQLSLTTLQLEEGLSLSIIITDLSFQKAIQEQLQQKNLELEKTNQELEVSNHDLQQFASVASHDLQEPLRKILIFSSFLKDKEDLTAADSKKYLEKIIESSRRMKALIIDTLTYSRLSATDFPTACVNLNEIVTELVEDFELMIQEKGARFIIGKLPCIDVNKGQIRQLFQNIISNALKFTKQETAPVISISSKLLATKSFDSVDEADGPFCMICIRDNGIGFDEKYVSKIFTLFERLNSKDKYEGTGIGMSIAKKIVEKHNGLITAVSREGKGTEFKIILPVQQPHV
jgi:PAS domain S-box-containing protein